MNAYLPMLEAVMGSQRARAGAFPESGREARGVRRITASTASCQGRRGWRGAAQWVDHWRPGWKGRLRPVDKGTGLGLGI